MSRSTQADTRRAAMGTTHSSDTSRTGRGRTTPGSSLRTVSVSWEQLGSDSFRGTDQGSASSMSSPRRCPWRSLLATAAKGSGHGCLTALTAIGRERGFEGLSLSVESRNRAVNLYTRLGFVVAHDENGAYTMRLDL